VVVFGGDGAVAVVVSGIHIVGVDVVVVADDAGVTDDVIVGCGCVGVICHVC